MENLLNTLISEEEQKDFREIVVSIADSGNEIVPRNGIIRFFLGYCDKYEKPRSFREKSSIFTFLKKAQELFVIDDHIALMHRYSIAKYRFYLIRKDGEYIEETDLAHYLDSKDYHFLKTKPTGLRLRLDFMPFYDFTPTIRDIRSVGNGIRFLNRYMSSNIFSRPREWLEKAFGFIKVHQYNGRQLLVNGTILSDPGTFLNELEKTLEWLDGEPGDAPYSSVGARLAKSGFEVGWATR